MQTINSSLENGGFTTAPKAFGVRIPKIQRHRAKLASEPTKRRLEPIWGVEREVRRWGLKAARNGKRRYASRAFTSLSGWEIGKAWNFYRLATGFSRIATGYYRLFPHDSTQVVDFPHLAMVRLFWGALKS